MLVGGALAAGSGILRLPTVVPPVPEPSVVAIATASPDATSPSPSESAAPSASPIPVAGAGGVWIPTGTMVTPRYYQMAVRLLDGRVLVIGGQSDAGDGLTSAELYDPATGTWSATGDMLGPTGGFPATLLRDGTVLVGARDQSAEVYDPATGTWSATGKMVSERPGGTATLLRNGKVLVAGYGNGTSELYDPDRGTWTATGKMTRPRHSQTAILLSDGKVLVAGGHAPRDEPTDAAELYDPDTGTWTAIANMQAPHDTFWTTLLLRDGKVLVVDPGESEVYDPTTGTWTTRDMPTEFMPNPMALLSDGTVLTEGIGEQPGGNDSDACTAAVFDPRTWSFTTISSMVRCADGPSTLLLDGTVLVAGGSECNDEQECIPNGVAELYVPAGVPMPPLPAFPSPPPPVFPSPTPRSTPFPPETGPVPPNAHSWKVTVDNDSSEPVTLFVVGDGESGISRLVGSATPNVVPAGTTVRVTFLFPDKGDNGWIYVNPRPGEGGGLVSGADIGIPGKIWIREDGEGGWLSP